MKELKILFDKNLQYYAKYYELEILIFGMDIDLVLCSKIDYVMLTSEVSKYVISGKIE